MERTINVLFFEMEEILFNKFGLETQIMHIYNKTICIR